MKSLILAYRRLAQASFMIRTLVGLLAFATAVLIEVLLDAVWTHLHINPFIADRFVQAAVAPIVGLLVAPMLSFLAQFSNEERSVRSQQSWQRDHFSKWDDDDTWDLWRDHRITADWHTDLEYSWFPGNIHHDAS